ncbi:MAG TPA: ATP-binding protein [Vicinamibacterales bacterium]|nr:ATP-binding protein [Vicinamibacterales bacterium]
MSHDRAGSEAARLELLEGFLNRSDLADCTEFALAWLAGALHIGQSLCLARREGTASLTVVGSHGLGASRPPSLTISTEDWRHPLVQILANRRHAFFGAINGAGGDRRRRPSTPFENGPFHVMPLRGPAGADEAIGLLIWGGSRRLTPDLEWFASAFSLKLAQLLRRLALSEGDRRQEYERSLLRAIVNAVTDPILLTDPEGRLLIANARARALFVAAEDESEGRRGAVAMNNMLLSSALSSKAIEETGAMRRELLLVNPVDGSDLLFELLSTVTEDARYGTGIVSILRNVGDLRRATEQIEENYRKMRVAEIQARAERDRLNLIIDSVADPIVVTDAGGATSLMNEPAERLFATQPGASTAEQRRVQSNDAHFSSFISGMLLSDDQRRVGEVQLIDPPTGAAMPVEAIAGKMLTEHGELTAIVSILHDRREAIERAALYEQLKQASEELERKVHAATADIAQQNELLRRQAFELEQASALKSQFLANMSHEFRTPLNAILGYTSMLQQGVAGSLDAPVKRHLARVASNGQHLLSIINEILDISRIEAGRMPLQISRFKLADLVGEVLAELDPIIRRSKLEITADVTRDLRPIYSDRQKVKQTLLNLLSNAIKFTPAGSVAIAARPLQGSKAVSITVTDTGIGIAPDDQQRIFEDFKQLDNSPTRAYGGTGLGLSICRRLAEIIGGSITVRSALGSGSTFTLTLTHTRQ